MYLSMRGFMTELNIKEYDLVNDVRTVKEEIFTEKKETESILFFGNLDVQMQEIDAAIRKLEQLSRQRLAVCEV